MLIQAMHGVRDKTIDHNQAKSIAMLASQVNASLAAELEARKLEAGLDPQGNRMPIGNLRLGSED